MKQTIILTILVALAVTLTACTSTPNIGSTGDTDTIKPGSALKKFNSANDIKEYLDSTRVYSGYNTFSGGARSVIMAESMAPTSAPMADMAMKLSGTDDYSQTNVQVDGVDEADFVKNDGEFIYVLSQNKLVIVDAYPAEDAEIVSETEVSGQPQNIFVNGDRLVVLSNINDQILTIPEYGIVPMPRYKQMTKVTIYDITDKKKPKEITDFTVSGYFSQARMIGDFVYVIANENVNYYDHVIDMPIVKQGIQTALRPEVYYFDNPEDNYNFVTVAAVDLETTDVSAKTFMMGYSNTVYVSENNIYIAYQKNVPYTNYRDNNQKRFYDVVVPLLPLSVQSKILNIKNGQGNSYEQWDKISVILETMYNTMKEDAKDDLITEIQEAVARYEQKLEQERRKTIIHKISIDQTEIGWVARGEVSGYLLNQFSMDEYDGNLRVATTTSIYRGAATMYNNVFVLDSNLVVMGKLEDIAPDERIYSTRFIGEKLYMVTFKQIDPLFVIDLSIPARPKVLGKLKIPGFSDYIHPYDKNHIIGIGKETEANNWGGVSTGGVKVALFDVSDVQNPVQIDSIEIGSKGSDSEALHDHKAILFDKRNDLLVLPIREIKGDRYYDDLVGYYTQRVWQGAYILKISPIDGISNEGKISHNDGQESDRWYWSSPWAVRRSLYMDDVLYTVSSEKIVMNNLLDVTEKIGEVDVPYKEQYYPALYR